MRPIIKLIKPDLTEVVLYVSIGFGLLVLNNLQKFWAYLSSGVSFDEAFAYNDLALQLQNKMLEFESSIDPRLADFTVWMIIGVISISVILIAQKVLGDTTDELKQVSKLRKTRFGGIVTHEAAYRFALRAAGLILITIWFRMFFGFLFSNLSQVFFESCINILNIKSLLLIISTVMISGLGIYIFAICLRLMTLRIRIFSN